MQDKEKEPLFQSGGQINDLFKGIYGMDPEMSLQSVNFATTENPYLNEHYQLDSKEDQC